MRSGRVLPELRYVSLQHVCVHLTGNCSELQGPEILLGFRHMGTSDETIGHVTEQFQTFLCSREVGGWAEIPNPLVKRSVTLVTNPILKLSRDPPGVTTPVREF